jgi:hypothetical protein
MIQQSWFRPVPAIDDFRAMALGELLPWRNRVSRDDGTWALGVVDRTVVVNSRSAGPDLWLPRDPWTGPTVLKEQTPLEVLLQNVAADLALTVACAPMESWMSTLELVRHWPHRRHWRSRGAGRAMRNVRIAEPPPRTPVEPAAEAAWTVVQFASSALPIALRVDPLTAWGHLAGHLQDQFALIAPGLIEGFSGQAR